MKKKILALVLMLALAISMLAGCNQGSADGSSASETESESETAVLKDVNIRIGSMKGPTSMGLVSLMDQTETGTAGQIYDFTMVTAADELLTKVVNKEIDIALVPANMASVLYNKTQGGISLINVNTLGVLYMVSADASITSIADLEGKTVYLTGKGQTPDYTLQYLLKENGLEGKVTLEYKSEATEVAAVLQQTADAIGFLPQPFVTAATSQNENLKIVLDATEEWNKLQGEGGSSLVTGVTIVRNEFLAEYEAEVAAFLTEYKASAEFTNNNTDTAAEMIAELGIVAKVPLAKKAIPYCNIVCVTGADMKAAVSGYLQVLFEQNAQSVGGALPAEDFYWMGE